MKNFTMKLEELKNTVGVQKTEEENFSSDDEYVIIDPKTGDKMCTPMSKEDCEKKLSGYPKGYKVVKNFGTQYNHRDFERFMENMDPNISVDDGVNKLMDKFGFTRDEAESKFKAYHGIGNFSNDWIPGKSGSKLMMYKDWNQVKSELTKLKSKSDLSKIEMDKIKFLEEALTHMNFSSDRHYWNWYAYIPEERVYTQGVSDADTEDKVREEVKKEHPTWKITKVIDILNELRGFSEESITVDSEATAREYGEALARNVFGDQFDQKIFDGVFATALEECGDDWNAVAAYLKNCYTKGNKNFIGGVDPWCLCTITDEGEIGTVIYSDNDKDKVKKYKSDYLSREGGRSDRLKIMKRSETLNFSKENKMKNFSERLAALEESVGIEPVAPVEVPSTPSPETQTPAVEASPQPETIAQGEEVTTTEQGSSTPAPVEPMNLSEEARTPVCPKCGKEPCECEHLEPIKLDFTDLLTEDEVNEIKNEANEVTKYPEQYGNTSEQVHAFSQWLESSRFNDFCKEALFKAFCK